MIYTPSELEKLHLRRSKYALDFAKLVRYLMAQGLIKNVVQLGEIAYAVKLDPRFTFAALCREAAGELPRGSFYDIGENGGMRWSMGNMVGGVLLPHSARHEIAEAQRIVGEVIPSDQRPPLSWTNGGNARQLVKWVLEREIKHIGEAESLLTPSMPGEDIGDKAYQYHDCKPGRYQSIIMYDLEAYYFTLISRAKSLDVSIYTPKNGSKPAICWGGWEGQEYAKWREVIAHIGDTKLLRNALWGVLLGSSGARYSYSGVAKPEHWKGGRLVPTSEVGRVRQEIVTFSGGMARALALLVGRSGAEVCAEAAAEVGSIYSTLDSVSVTDGSTPRTWAKLGLPSGIKERGPGEIVARGVWNIGDNHTKDYYPDGRIIPVGYKCPIEPIAVERRFYTTTYNRLWLG